MSEKISVWDILPDFGSYVSDMESNIRMDEETWERYEDEPEGYLIDLLGDFGIGEWEDDQIESAVLDYLGKNQGVGSQHWPPPGVKPLSAQEKKELLFPQRDSSDPDEESETFWGIIESMNKKSLDGVRSGLEKLNRLHLED